MLTVAYLANRFPATVEPYVVEEIEELRSRGIRVIAGSVRRPVKEDELLTMRCSPEVVLQPLHARHGLDARAGAGGEEEVRDPDLAAQEVRRDGKR